FAIGVREIRRGGQTCDFTYSASPPPNILLKSPERDAAAGLVAERMRRQFVPLSCNRVQVVQVELLAQFVRRVHQPHGNVVRSLNSQALENGASDSVS